MGSVVTDLVQFNANNISVMDEVLPPLPQLSAPNGSTSSALVSGVVGVGSEASAVPFERWLAMGLDLLNHPSVRLAADMHLMWLSLVRMRRARRLPAFQVSVQCAVCSVQCVCLFYC